MSDVSASAQQRDSVPPPAGGDTPPTGSQIGRKGRRTVSQRQRPLWMLLPGGVLMIVVILIPLLIGIYISLIDLDQYTLRRWYTAPFVGLQNYVEAITETGLLNSIWISVSFAVISTVVTVPIGVAAAVVTQNAYRGRGLVRAVFLIPYVLPSFVVASVWRTMLQFDGIVNVRVLGNLGIEPALWLSGPLSYWTLVLVEIWAAWPFIYLLALSGLQSVDGEVHEASALDGRAGGASCATWSSPTSKGPWRSPSCSPPSTTSTTSRCRSCCSAPPRQQT